MQQVFLSSDAEGGDLMVLRCTLRATCTASLLDPAKSRSMIPGSPAAAAVLAPALPAYATSLQSFGQADAPDLQPATVLTSPQ
jgi:hypothetical protein